jgi:FKBP-type peptidyl-prolyl cis-trans isomerase SlyD
VVTLHYKLQEKYANGAIIEHTFDSDPLVFLYGAGQMLPEFERNLAGRQVDDEFSFGIISSDAYGEYDSEDVVLVPKETFMIDGKLAEDLLVPGKIIPMHDNNGNHLRAKVIRIQPDGVLLDFNHPMAGQDLFFTVRIDQIRHATQSEIDHGHVHGEGGHHH